MQKLYLFNAACQTLRQSIISCQRNYEQHLSNHRKTKPKLFHSYIRKKKTARPSVGPLRINGQLSDDPQDMANQFVNAFATVFTTDSPDNPSPHQQSPAVIDDVDFTVSDVENQLKSLKTYSAMGPDKIHPVLLKQCAHTLARPFYLLFKSSLVSGSVPTSWKHSSVIPIFKKGPKTDPLNYRPISLTPIPCKTMERIITKTLYGFLESHLILDDAQYGFRSGRSVTDQLLLTYNKITQWYDAGHTVDLILFDFVKAFDRVHHETLLAKLAELGISGNLYRWIESFLANRTMSVSIKDIQSWVELVASGVPQGSVIGPLLFLIFINHLGATLTCNYMMFADDLKLYIHHPNKLSPPQISQELQDNINRLSSIAASWGLKFAPEKCVHLHFKRGLEDAPAPQYKLDGTNLKTPASHQDLGVTIDTSLRFHPHIRTAANKAGGVATNLLKSTVCRSPSFMTTLLISDIRPILDFASPVWNTRFEGDTHLLESVQRRWTKEVCGLSPLSYEERLIRLNLLSMRGRLLRADLIQC